MSWADLDQGPGLGRSRGLGPYPIQEPCGGVGPDLSLDLDLDLGRGLGRGRVLISGLNLNLGQSLGLGPYLSQGAVNERCNYEKGFRRRAKRVEVPHSIRGMASISLSFWGVAFRSVANAVSVSVLARVVGVRVGVGVNVSVQGMVEVKGSVSVSVSVKEL